MNTPNPENEERRSLRKQLRKAGWNIGAMSKAASGVAIELWPAPHTGPAEGIEPRRVEGPDKTSALRNALGEGAA